MEATQAIEKQSSAWGCLGEVGWLGAGFILPCASLMFYRRAARRKVTAAILFFLVFSSVITILWTFRVVRTMVSLQSEMQSGIREAFDSGDLPEIVIQDGVARVDAEQPLVLFDDQDMIIVLDTTGTYERLDRSTHSEGLLLTRTSLHFMNEDGRYQEIPLEAFHGLFGNPIVINAASLSRAWASFTTLATIAAFLGLAIWHILIRLAYLAILALILWAIAAQLRPNTGFGPVLITGLYAIVPAMYANYLLGRLGVQCITVPTLILLPLWVGGLVAALAGPDRGFLGRERPLRGWRALIGIPLLLVLALDIALDLPSGAAIIGAVGAFTFVLLLVIGLWMIWRQKAPDAPDPAETPEVS